MNRARTDSKYSIVVLWLGCVGRYFVPHYAMNLIIFYQAYVLKCEPMILAQDI